MDCPVCGSSERRSLGAGRYTCTAPGRLVTVTPPPTIGSTWGPVTFGGTTREPCGAVFTDQEERSARNRTSILLLI